MEKLTRRERECLELVAHGETNEQIAEGLSVGVETIRTHLNHLYRALAVQDAGNPRVAAAVLWVRTMDKEQA